MQELPRPESAAPKRSLKPWWIALSIVAGLVVVLLIAILIYSVSANGRWVAALDRMEEAGVSLNPDDWGLDPVPADDDAAPEFIKAFDLMKKNEQVVEEAIVLLADLKDGDRVDVEVIQLVESPEITAIIQQLHEASTRPDGHFDLDFAQGYLAMVEESTTSLRAAKILVLDLEIASRDGNLQRTCRSYRTMLRLADVTRGQASSISHLVSIAIRSLADPKYLLMAANRTSEPLTPLINVLATLHGRMPMDESLSWMLDTEFFMAVHSLRMEIEGSKSFTGSSSVPLVGGAFLKRNTARIIDFYLDIRKRLAVPEYEMIDVVNEIEKEITSSKGQGFWMTRDDTMLNLVVPAYMSIYNRTFVSEALSRVAEAAIRARLMFAETGTWPTSMEALNANDGGATLKDPYTGNPLTLKVDEADLLIYSVAADGEDNGGDFGTPEMAEIELPDVGVRVTASR